MWLVRWCFVHKTYTSSGVWCGAEGTKGCVLRNPAEKVVPLDATVIEQDETGRPLLTGVRILQAARAYRQMFKRRSLDEQAADARFVADVGAHGDALEAALVAYCAEPGVDATVIPADGKKRGSE